MRLSTVFLLATSALAFPTSQPQAAHDSPSISARGIYNIVAGALGANWYTPYSQQKSGQSGSGSESSVSYEKYCGSVAKYPPMKKWQTFDSLWQINLPVIKSKGTSDKLIAVLKAKILAIALESQVDARVILATIMQESGGKLDVPCTAKVNCGIMQGPPGSQSYDSSNPAKSIESMIRVGVHGHEGSWPNGGPGLAWLIALGHTDPTVAIKNKGNLYEALRAYNTGRLSDPSNLDIAKSGTPSYVNDIANRLRGWDGSGTGQVNANLACH
ncbi:uncharacterized protein K452DRAFT_288374 [Aplosporella prunicola CBS 121167]|uniref:Transglycosylase SLT domain-containing protein n=1 Tax=Aplosporella prunicola CBS 121167 TaxID=1176127 RepID=A0A6A6BAE0_9PEZI|nr:uncharacterized protein K452DRAFT_288374 [Aplosporella prunicola CBS 121167]KAF2140986.1 hypothetical protein K452DRAFT_288374 [Aplosporella prunicola CBS 121167]